MDIKSHFDCHIPVLRNNKISSIQYYFRKMFLRSALEEVLHKHSSFAPE